MTNVPRTSTELPIIWSLGHPASGFRARPVDVAIENFWVFAFPVKSSNRYVKQGLLHLKNPFFKKSSIFLMVSWEFPEGPLEVPDVRTFRGPLGDVHGTSRAGWDIMFFTWKLWIRIAFLNQQNIVWKIYCVSTNYRKILFSVETYTCIWDRQYANICLLETLTTLREESNAEEIPAEFKNANLAQNSHSLIPRCLCHDRNLHSLIWHFLSHCGSLHSLIPHFLNSRKVIFQMKILPFRKKLILPLGRNRHRKEDRNKKIL